MIYTYNIVKYLHSRSISFIDMIVNSVLSIPIRSLSISALPLLSAMPALLISTFLIGCGEQTAEVTGPTYMKESKINIMTGKIKIVKPDHIQTKAELVRMLGMDPSDCIAQWIDEKCKAVGSTGTTIFQIVQAQIYEKGDTEYHGKVRLKIRSTREDKSEKEIDVSVKAMQQFPAYSTYQSKINALQDLMNELINTAHEYTRQEIYKKGNAKEVDYFFG